MNVIYIDTLFLINTVIDYLLLLASARIAGEPLYRLRFGLGAILGGGYAVALFLPGLGFLYHPLCRLAVAIFMVLTAFSRSRRLLRQILIFFALACAFGGGVLAAGMLGGQTLTFGNGVFYSTIDLKIVLVSAAVCYGVLSLIFQRWGRHSVQRGEIEQVIISIFDKQISLLALIDTGNTLSDPVSGQPVWVMEGRCLHDLLPEVDESAFRNPAGAMERLNQLLPGRFRLLPYRSVGVDCGLLLAVRMDWIETGRERRNGVLIALSPNPVSDGGGYQVLAWAD